MENSSWFDIYEYVTKIPIGCCEYLPSLCQELIYVLPYSQEDSIFNLCLWKITLVLSRTDCNRSLLCNDISYIINASLYVFLDQNPKSWSKEECYHRVHTMYIILRLILIYPVGIDKSAVYRVSYDIKHTLHLLYAINDERFPDFFDRLVKEVLLVIH